MATLDSWGMLKEGEKIGMGIDEVNQLFFQDPKVVNDYIQQDSLWFEEEIILERYADGIRGKEVLDIGCGGGRTTTALIGMTDKYVGLDYSKLMIESVGQRFPKNDFCHGDASHMTMFTDGRFDFVLFSFNGIDGMSRENREQTLSEIYRVLKPGGVFAFSAHNRADWRRVRRFNPRELNPVVHWRNYRSYLAARDYELREVRYEILSDPLHGFGCLTYYVLSADQVAQLAEVGFSEIQVMNRKGKFVNARQRSRMSQWLHYICTKRP